MSLLSISLPPHGWYWHCATEQYRSIRAEDNSIARFSKVAAGYLFAHTALCRYALMVFDVRNRLQKSMDECAAIAYRESMAHLIPAGGAHSDIARDHVPRRELRKLIKLYARAWLGRPTDDLPWWGRLTRFENRRHLLAHFHESTQTENVGGTIVLAHSDLGGEKMHVDTPALEDAFELVVEVCTDLSVLLPEPHAQPWNPHDDLDWLIMGADGIEIVERAIKRAEQRARTEWKPGNDAARWAGEFNAATEFRMRLALRASGTQEIA